MNIPIPRRVYCPNVPASFTIVWGSLLTRLLSLTTFPYRESVFTGHRWYESKGLSPLYPFGHGLSYTTFEISEPIVEIADGSRIRVSANVKNTGTRPALEVVQLYVGGGASDCSRPGKELKGICKVNLAPGETKVAAF